MCLIDYVMRFPNKNIANKLIFWDLKEQNLRDIVWMNDQKVHTASLEFATALK